MCLQWSYYSLALCYRCDGTINMFQQLYLNVYTLFYVFEKPVHYWCPVLSGMCWYLAWALRASLQRKVYQMHWKQNAVHLFVLKVKVLLMVRENRQYAFRYINVELNNLTTWCYYVILLWYSFSNIRNTPCWDCVVFLNRVCTFNHLLVGLDVLRCHAFNNLRLGKVLYACQQKQGPVAT